MCEVLANAKQFEGQKIRLNLEASFIANDALVSHGSCQATCAIWRLEPALNETENGKLLLAAILKERRTTGYGESADVIVEGQIKYRGKYGPRLVVSKIVEFKMRDDANGPKIVCGNDMQATHPVGDCSVDAAGCE